MARVSAHARLSNAVVRKLEAGNGSVKGMKILVPVEGEALFPVEVVGIAFGRCGSDGVTVLVKPIGGIGTLSVNATELLDNTETSRTEYAAKAKAAEYLRSNTPKDSASDKNWRAATMQERSLMTEKQRTRFDGLAPRHFREKVDMVDGIKGAAGWELKRIFPMAVRVRFDADQGDLDYED